jgi:putative two-component system response regulator
MSLPAARSTGTEVLSTETALTTLTAMVRAERTFDSDVVERIEELFRALPDEHASVDLVQGLLNVQLLWYQELLFRRGVPAGLKAVRWSRQLGDRALLAKALTYRAALAAENLDLSLAFEASIEALQIGKEIGDAFRIATCYCNLGSLMRTLGRNQAAMACVEAGLEWCKDPDTAYEKVRAVAMTTLSELHLSQGNWLAALNSARAAQGFFDQVDGDMTHCACAIRNEVSAHLHLLNFESAVNAIERLKKRNKQYPSAAAESYLRQAEAIYESFVGNTARAVKTLREFGKSPPMRDGALRELVDIYERAGEPDKALEVTRELIEHLRSTRWEVTEADLDQIDISSLADEDSDVRELIARSARFEVEALKVSDRSQAKLAYLFELGVSAELREEDGTHAGEHIYRVGRLCAALAIEAGCGEELCWLAEIAGRAHDVGKTSLPSHTILKTDPLTDGEREILRAHAEDGAALVAQLAEPRLVQVVAAVRHHHENWDGSGYPNRLSGEQIPLLARIVAICDSFDAMTHSRPFRSARSITGGLQEIERCAGTQFDPSLAGLFVNLVWRLQREHEDLDEYLGEPGRRTRWAKSHPELMRLLEERQLS